MIFLTLYITIIIIVVVKGVYKSIPLIKSFSVRKNIEFISTSVQIECLPFIFNAPKINLFLISFIILIGIFFNIICSLNYNIAYCMDCMNLIEDDFTKQDLKFLRQKMVKTEQLTSKINLLNNQPKFFKNLDFTNNKISYNYIYDFKKYKLTKISNGIFLENSFAPEFEFLSDFEKQFNNATQKNEKITISLNALIIENGDKCFRDFKIFNINQSFEEYFKDSFKTKILIKKIILDTIENFNKSFDILYNIKSSPVLVEEEKKYLMKKFKSSLIRFLPEYSYIDKYFIRGLPENFDQKNIFNKKFVENFLKFQKLNLKNITIIKEMSLIKEKKLENIIITSPISSEPESVESITGDIVRIMDGTLNNSSANSSFADSEEETKSESDIDPEILEILEKFKNQKPDHVIVEENGSEIPSSKKRKIE